MKLFKKVVATCVGLLAVTSLAACNGGNNEALDGAARRVQVTQDKSEAVTGDFLVARTVTVDGVKYTVTWESDNAVAKVVEAGADKYLIDIDYAHNNEAAQTVNLKATVSDGKSSTTKTFTFKVPKFVVSTIAEADAASSGASLTLKGVITAKEAYSSSNKGTNVYLQSAEGKGGFEAYKLACTEEQYNNELKIGNTIYVSGPKAYYNGLRELSPTTYIYDDTEATKTLTPESLNAVVEAGKGINEDYQGHLVSLTDVEIVDMTAPDATGQYSIYVGSITDKTKQALVRISKYFFTGKSATDYAFSSLVIGQKINVTGFLGWYSGAQITPTAATGIEAGDIDVAHALAGTYASKAKQLIGDKVIPGKVIDLPSRLKDIGLTGEAYEGYTIEYVKSEGAPVAITTKNISAVAAKPAEGDKPAVEAEAAYVKYTLTTSKPEADANVTLTVNVKDENGEVVFSRDVTFKVLSEVKYTSFADYIKAADGTELNVQGVIVAIKSDKKNIWLQDENGKVFLCYFSTAQNDLAVGDKIGASGTVANYNAADQLSSAVLIEKLASGQTVTYTNYTENFATNGYTGFTAEDQYKAVEFSGVLKTVDGNNYTVTVGTDKDVLVYAYCTLPTGVAAGDTVTVKGLLGAYYNKTANTTTYQVYLLDTKNFVVTYTDEQKATKQLAALTGAISNEQYKVNTQINLAPSFEGATVEVTVAAGATTLAYDATTKVLTVTPKETATSEKVTIKVTVNEVVKTAEVTIAAQVSQVGLKATMQYTTNSTTNMTADGSDNADKLGLGTTLFSVTATARGTLYPGLNKNGYFALYATNTSGNANILTVTIAEGWTIDSIKVTFKAGETLAVLKVGDNTLTKNEDGTYTIGGRSFTMTNGNTANSDQVQITKIEITYSKVSA